MTAIAVQIERLSTVKMALWSPRVVYPCDLCGAPQAGGAMVSVGAGGEFLGNVDACNGCAGPSLEVRAARVLLTMPWVIATPELELAVCCWLAERGEEEEP